MGTTSLDTAFVGGAVFDGASTEPVLTDVGVAGGVIVAIGRDAVREAASLRTRVVDMTGRLLTPGFIDAHVHPTEGGVERIGCDLSAGTTRAEYLATVRDYAASHPRDEWIVGGGWAQAVFAALPPTRDELDAVCADRPVALANRDHHGIWVNSAALRLVGIDSATPDPVDGVIVRDAAGIPTGLLHEGAADAVLAHMPPVTSERLYDGFQAAQEYLHSVGITGWQDALIGDNGNHSIRELDVYESAIGRGELTARVNGALWWERARGFDQLAEMAERRSRYDHDLFRVRAVKVMQDGIPENRTAAMLDPYLDPQSGLPGEHAGLSFFDPRLLADIATRVDAAGFQLHFHAIGDRAVRECLDAVAGARRANGPDGSIHHIAHLQVVADSDVARFAALRVAANIQPLWAAYDRQMADLNVPLLGAERIARSYPFASLAAAGATLCAGSDWPVTSADPWAGIHVAVNRQYPAADPDWNPDPFVPSEALTLGTAIAAYTSGSARINSRDDQTGAIRLGYAADLAVADRNPFDLPAGEIAETRTDETFFAGESVYRRVAAVAS